MENGAHQNRVLAFAGVAAVVLVGASTGGETDEAVSASRFLGRVGSEAFATADPPAEPIVFRWDFSDPERVLTYAYEQETRNAMASRSLPGKPMGGGQEMSVDGLLRVKSRGDGAADLVLDDMAVRVTMDFGQGEPKTVEQRSPPMVMSGMREDGSASFGGSPQEAIFKMLFPLPPEPLSVGESVDVPTELPFNAQGSMLRVTGRLRITLTGYVTIGDRTCAQLDVDIDISELDAPSELEGEYSFSTTGASVVYFDVADRAIVLGESAALMRFRIDAPAPKFDFGGEDAPKGPERVNLSMTADTFGRVQREE